MLLLVCFFVVVFLHLFGFLLLFFGGGGGLMCFWEHMGWFGLFFVGFFKYEVYERVCICKIT